MRAARVRSWADVSASIPGDLVLRGKEGCFEWVSEGRYDGVTGVWEGGV